MAPSSAQPPSPEMEPWGRSRLRPRHGSDPATSSRSPSPPTSVATEPSSSLLEGPDPPPPHHRAPKAAFPFVSRLKTLAGFCFGACRASVRPLTNLSCPRRLVVLLALTTGLGIFLLTTFAFPFAYGFLAFLSRQVAIQMYGTVEIPIHEPTVHLASTIWNHLVMRLSDEPFEKFSKLEKIRNDWCNEIPEFLSGREPPSTQAFCGRRRIRDLAGRRAELEQDVLHHDIGGPWYDINIFTRELHAEMEKLGNPLVAEIKKTNHSNISSTSDVEKPANPEGTEMKESNNSNMSSASSVIGAESNGSNISSASSVIDAESPGSLQDADMKAINGSKIPSALSMIDVYLRAYDRFEEEGVHLQSFVESSAAKEHQKWSTYQRRNEKAYEKNRLTMNTQRLPHGRVLGGAYRMLHVANIAEAMFIRTYRPMLQELQSLCHSPFHSNYSAWDSDLRFKFCLPYYEKRLVDVEDYIRDLRASAPLVFDAVTRVEALRCGLRQVVDYYTPLRRTGRVTSLPEARKQCRRVASEPSFGNMFSWMHEWTQWPQDRGKTCHGRYDGERCYLTKYGTTGLERTPYLDYIKLYEYSSCLVATLRSCGSISFNPLWHLRNLAPPAGLATLPNHTIWLYGCGEEPLDPVLDFNQLGTRIASVQDKRRLDPIWFDFRKQRLMVFTFAQALAAHIRVLIWEECLLGPVRVWQDLVVKSMEYGQLMASRMLPWQLPITLPPWQEQVDALDQIVDREPIDWEIELEHKKREPEERSW